LRIIFLSAARYTVEQLSEMFDLCQTTIRNYIHSYNKSGLDELKPGKPTGRPPKIANWTKEQWDEVLERTPDQYEKLGTHSHCWTLELLALYLKRYHDVDVDISNIHRSLIRTGRRMGRSKLHVGSPDPEYAIKRRSVKAVQDLPLGDN